MDASGDKRSYVEFLQDQVNRLSSILKEYQRRYSPIAEDEIQADDSLPPWMTNPSLLSPLLVEYDNNIRKMKEQIQIYEQEQDKLRDKADRIVDENTRLHDELRKSVENQLDSLKHIDGTSCINQLTLDRLNHQLEILTEEKNNYVELWEAAADEANQAKDALREKSFELSGRLSELATIQEDLQKARQYAEDVQHANQKLKMEHETFLQTAQLQDHETNASREELRKTKVELKTCKTQNEDLVNNLQKLQDRVAMLTEDSDKINIIEKSSEQAIKELQNTIVTLELRSSTAMEEIAQLRNEKSNYEETISVLQQKNTDLGQREYRATLHVRDSVQLVENAMLEKEQAVLREQQKSQEIKRLQESIDNILSEAEKRKDNQFEFLRKQHKDQLATAEQEIRHLEVESAERQAQLDRTTREKSSVERELEKLYQAGYPHAGISSDDYDDLQRQLARVEVSRDEALLHVEALQTKLLRSETRHASERSTWETQLQDSRRRITAVQNQTEKTSASRLKLVEEIDQLKREVMSANQSRDDAEMQCAKQVAQLKQKLELQERDHESRLHATEDLSRRTADELRDMLNAQRKIGTKWREESKLQAQKFESATNEMRQDISRIRRKNSELSKAFTEEQDKNEELEQQILSVTSTLEKLQRIAADNEAKSDAASAQIQTLLSREKELLRERKQLHRDLDRLKLEAVRSTRGNANAAQWTALLNGDTADTRLDTIPPPRDLY